jgi:hypothetical protein
MKEYWRLLEVGEARQKGDEWLDDTCGNHRWKPSEMLGSSVEGSVLYRRRITVPDWPTPIAFADEKPKEGQKILYWQPIAKEWRRERAFSIFQLEQRPYATHWLPAPPDLPEPKPAWEVAWDALDKSCMTHDTRYTFMLGFKAAQKEKV